LAADASGAVWAIVDGKEIWRRAGEWSSVAAWDGSALTCLSAGGPQPLAGTVGAHVLHLVDGTLLVDEAFDELPERKTWYELVNIHVGGVARRDRGGPWGALVDIDVDVHQVMLAPDGSIVVATGAVGFGRSADGGQTWRWDHDGLHGSYCRAVAVAGDQVLLTASTGPGRTRGAVYRRALGAEGPWQRVTDLVSGNIDTFWLTARQDAAAFVAPDGEVWRSGDAGATWERADKVAGSPRAVILTD
jgi:hypothetical protein